MENSLADTGEHSSEIQLLIVEDNPVDAKLLLSALRKSGNLKFNSTCVDTLAKPIEILRDSSFDVILLHLLLPDASGIRVISEVFEAKPEVPIVVLTSLDDEQFSLKAIKIGVQDYVVKGETHYRRIGQIIRYAMERKGYEASIRAALEEKKVLLKEIHHRVKNNFQLILSMLSIQSESCAYLEAQRILKETQDRFKSISLVHELLLPSEDLARVRVRDYLESLSQNILCSATNRRNTLDLNLNIDEIYLGLDAAIACGLVVNELVSFLIRKSVQEGKQREGIRGV